MRIKKERARAFMTDVHNIMKRFIFLPADDANLVRANVDVMKIVKLYEGRFPEFDYYRPTTRVYFAGDDIKVDFGPNSFIDALEVAIHS